MSIAWNEFTPWSALAGGLLIGLAAAMFVLLNGRIAGISGIIGGLFKPIKGEVTWRAVFVLGLIGSPWLYALFAALPQPRIDASFGALVIAGLLVGVAPVTVRAAPAGTACAGWPACRRDRWWRRWLSWRPVLRPCSSPATCLVSEESLP